MIGGVGLDQGYAGGVAPLGVDIAELLDDLNVAGLERQHHRLRRFEGLDFQAVEVGLGGVPVVGIALERGAFLRAVGDQLEQAGADRLFGEIAGVVGGQDHAVIGA